MHQPWAVNQAWTRPEWGWWWQDAVAVYRAGDQGGFVTDMVTGIMSDGGASVGLDQYGHTLAFDGGVGGIALNNPSLTQLTVPFTITVVGRVPLGAPRAVIIQTRQFGPLYTGFALRHQAGGRFNLHYGDGGGGLSPNRRSFFFFFDDFYGDDIAQAATLSITVGYFSAEFVAFGNGRRLSLEWVSGTTDTMVHHPEGTGVIGPGWLNHEPGLTGGISMISLHNGAWTEAQHRAWRADPFGALRMRALPVPPQIVEAAVAFALRSGIAVTRTAEVGAAITEAVALADAHGGAKETGAAIIEAVTATFSALGQKALDADMVAAFTVAHVCGASADFEVSIEIDAAFTVGAIAQMDAQALAAFTVAFTAAGVASITLPPPDHRTITIARDGRTIIVRGS